ncbi:MAG: sulfatase, partial [Gammaproteobacteria bacterium]|nr:sulfatase [Gammaproteobacteria bacterium]
MNKWIVSIAIVGAVIALAWVNRIELLLTVVKFQSDREFVVEPERELPWQVGPAESTRSDEGAPPNIIVILADDLGYNDISTFGGGLAGGAVETPSIDALAASGVVFEQSYAGNATCAPSRA